MKEDEVIATCSGLFNSTAAKCASTNATSTDDFVCWIQDCPKEEEGDFFPFYIFIILGALCYAFEVLLPFSPWKSKKKKNGEGDQDTNGSDFFTCSLHDLGHYFEIGTYLIILGTAMKSVKTSLVVWGSIYIFPYFLLILMLLVMSLSRSRELCNEQKEMKHEPQETEAEKKSLCDSASNDDSHGKVKSTMNDDSYKVIRYQVEDVYLDMKTTKIRVVSTFVCQGALLGMYAYLIFHEGKPDFASFQTYVFYFLGAAIQMVKADAWTIKDRSHYMDNLINSSNYLHENNAQREETKPYAYLGEYFLRLSGAVLINLFGRDILLLLLPLHLAQSENTMNFVLNAIAAYFILELDDLKETEMSYKKYIKKKDNPIIKHDIEASGPQNQQDKQSISNDEEKSTEHIDWPSTKLTSKEAADDLLGDVCSTEENPLPDGNQSSKE